MPSKVDTLPLSGNASSKNSWFTVYYLEPCLIIFWKENHFKAANHHLYKINIQCSPWFFASFWSRLLGERCISSNQCPEEPVTDKRPPRRCCIFYGQDWRGVFLPRQADGWGVKLFFLHKTPASASSSQPSDIWDTQIGIYYLIT